MGMRRDEMSWFTRMCRSMSEGFLMQETIDYDHHDMILDVCAFVAMVLMLIALATLVATVFMTP